MKDTGIEKWTGATGVRAFFKKERVAEAWKDVGDVGSPPFAQIIVQTGDGASNKKIMCNPELGHLAQQGR
jgi:hypothetical protein